MLDGLGLGFLARVFSSGEEVRLRLNGRVRVRSGVGEVRVTVRR